MAGKNDAFMKRLLSTFKVEADEHIKNITAGLIELEKDLEPQVKAGIIEAMFREAHSLKGAARAVNLTDIETICQSLESVFSGLKTPGNRSGRFAIRHPSPGGGPSQGTDPHLAGGTGCPP